MKKVYSLLFDNFKNDSRVLKEARSLQKNGYNVKIIAVYEPLLKEYDVIEGVEVVRIKLKTKPKNSYSSTLINLEYMYKVFKKYGDADIYHCNDLNTLPCVIAIKKLKNSFAKIVYDAHEYETERLVYGKIKSFMAKILESHLIKYVDTTFCVSKSIADIYVKDYKIKQPALILNSPLLQINKMKNNIFREKFNIKEDQKIFIYQGRLTKGRGIENILDAFLLYPKHVVIFMGFGVMSVRILKYMKKAKNIFLHEPVPFEDIIKYSNSADYGLCMIDDICLSYYYSLPNKLFEYMMADIPVIASNIPELKNFTQNHKVGVVAKDKTVESLSEAIEEITKLDYNKLKENIEKIKPLYSWEVQEKILLLEYKNFYKSVK